MTDLRPEPEIVDEEPAAGYETFRDLDAVKPLGHPLRMRAYIEAVKGPVSAKDLSERLDVPLQRMSYHVRALADAGLLRVVRRTPRRGAMETHYRAIATFDFTDQAFAEASPETIDFWAQAHARRIFEEQLHELERGSGRDSDYFLARAHFRVDCAGRARLHEELRDIYRRLEALERELRVEPGEGVEEVNVLFSQYAGERTGGRNGPSIQGLTEDYDTIPPE